ncbi:putative sterigmatocystin biosynthesis monooxygenase stcW [Neonectria ditissima]|uniref:Putative sterigmatocystin biosynthesis monooxygenase stcW n=1 Tax=Neonectria ditissima TaxID=78410 RepID=A0A0P7B818_9HYPO|nr:putative sterigmatocystin biosynthesis monooxygenase stcW [Neonectria ditissima]
MNGTLKPEPRRLRCTIIGAGVSGLLMAYKIRKHLSDYVDFAIYEKSAELGGTWHENTYPGCACDVPSHCYQYSFAPNPAWSKFYASSGEIKEYLKGVARHFRLEQFIHYNLKVTSARWSTKNSAWTIELHDGRVVESEILINAGGILNHPQMPDIEGLSGFSGPLLHTAAWDSSVNLKDKRIAIIGSGASAVQLLPQVQPLARKIQVYIRTPSWICPPVALPKADVTNYNYTKSEKEKFRWNEETYLKTRKDLESQFNAMFRAFFKNSPDQRDIRHKFESRMKSLIPDKNLQKHLIPTFEAGCRRINPGEDFLISLQKPNVQPVFESIERVTLNGIVAGGAEFEADILVAATGFNTTFKPRFPIYGANGNNLQDLWAQDPVSYMGTGVAGFPNYFMFLGPNTPISNGSLMGPVEATGDYFIRILRKMIRQRILSFDVREDAQSDFNEHTQSRMRDMVWTGTCRSWFKRGTDGKVTALWPGSALHYMQVLSENRWEDYEWKYERERYDYWGHGVSWVESPELDPLGVEEQESLINTTTIPRRNSDLSFYLWKSPPLPRAAVSLEEMDEYECGSIAQPGLVNVNGVNGVSPRVETNGVEVSVAIPV